MFPQLVAAKGIDLENAKPADLSGYMKDTVDITKYISGKGTDFIPDYVLKHLLTKLGLKTLLETKDDKTGKPFLTFDETTEKGYTRDTFFAQAKKAIRVQTGKPAGCGCEDIEAATAMAKNFPETNVTA